MVLLQKVDAYISFLFPTFCNKRISIIIFFIVSDLSQSSVLLICYPFIRKFVFVLDNSHYRLKFDCEFIYKYDFPTDPFSCLV